jgi:hypothetical protein
MENVITLFIMLVIATVGLWIRVLYVRIREHKESIVHIKEQYEDQCDDCPYKNYIEGTSKNKLKLLKKG